MSQIHPSRWTIKHENDKKFCQSLHLPLGPDGADIYISTKLFNKIWAEYNPKRKSYLAGEFAQALRELRVHKIDLGTLPQVNTNAAESCYIWLDLYEGKLVEYGVKQREAEKAITAPQKLQLAPESSPMYKALLLMAVKEYIIMAGPMGDAKLIAEKAKAVARACTEE